MSDEMKNCPACGDEILASAKKCKHCGEWLDKSAMPEGSGANALPAGHNAFNWGAFLLTWIWGIGNKTYIAFLAFAAGLFSLIPFIGWLVPLGFAIWLGIKGNELAWKNGDWKNIEHFEETQRKWAMWGGIVVGVSALLGMLFFLLAAIGLAASGMYD